MVMVENTHKTSIKNIIFKALTSMWSLRICMNVQWTKYRLLIESICLSWIHDQRSRLLSILGRVVTYVPRCLPTSPQQMSSFKKIVQASSPPARRLISLFSSLTLLVIIRREVIPVLGFVPCSIQHHSLSNTTEYLQETSPHWLWKW